MKCVKHARAQLVLVMSYWARLLLHSIESQSAALYLTEGPGELHVLGGGVAALQEPRPAVHVHQTLVVVVVDGRAQDSQVELLGAGVVDVLQADGDRG